MVNFLFRIFHIDLKQEDNRKAIGICSRCGKEKRIRNWQYQSYTKSRYIKQHFVNGEYQKAKTVYEGLQPHDVNLCGDCESPLWIRIPIFLFVLAWIALMTFLAIRNEYGFFETLLVVVIITAILEYLSYQANGKIVVARLKNIAGEKLTGIAGITGI